MQAPGHFITNISLAVATENLLHLAGLPLRVSDITSFATVGVTAILLPKALFYGAMLLTATLPDADQRVPVFGKHRSFTHSIAGLLSLVSVLLCLQTLFTSVVLVFHLALPANAQGLETLLLIALPLGCAFHILADLITIRGVRLFWPAQRFIRIVPKGIAIKNQHASEFLVVSILFLGTGLLLLLSAFGL